jgi:hypothetical protein
MLVLMPNIFLKERPIYFSAPITMSKRGGGGAPSSGDSGSFAAMGGGMLATGGPSNSSMFFGMCSNEEESSIFCSFMRAVTVLQMLLFILMILGFAYFAFEFLRNGGLGKMKKWAKNIK